MIPRRLRTASMCLAILAVAVPASAAVGKRLTVLTYGEQLKLTGVAPAAYRSKTVDLLAKPCSFTAYGVLKRLNVDADGKYAYATSPTISTSFIVRAGTTQIATASVRVRPLVEVRVLGKGRFELVVTTAGGTSLEGKQVLLQTGASARGPWTVAQKAKLKLTSSPTAMNATSAARISARVPKGRWVRAQLVAGQAAPCYAAAVSAPAAG